MLNPNRFDSSNLCLHAIFEDIASKRPDGTAVRHDDTSYRFYQLNNNANQLAHAIIQKLGKETTNVAILIENSYHQIVAILAILKAGKCYVPLDIDHPFDRIKSVMRDANCMLLLSTTPHQDLAEGVIAPDRVLIADMLITDEEVENPDIDVSPTDPALIPYTSGSTGDPKGAIHTHQSIVHLIKRTNLISQVTEDDVVGYFFSFAFSAHALPLFIALLNGCTLSVINIQANKLTGMLEWLTREKISVALFIPSFIRHLTATMPRKFILESFRLMYLGGETLFRSDIEKLRPHINDHTRLINIYASTECYICCALPIDKNSVLRGNIMPIGYEVDGVSVDIIDEEGKVLVTGETGTIRIKSKYISSGYQNQDLNKGTFTLCDKGTIVYNSSDMGFREEDGCIVHVGREESFIKLRGYRIDLQEIQNILLELDDVKEATCVLKQNPAGAEHIVAYLVPVSSSEPDLDLARTKMIRRLPDYMIPTHIVTLPELTKLASGKLDLSQLPEPEWEATGREEEYTAPSTETEAALVEIFERSLKMNPIGIEENFLKLGADSLSLFVIISKIEKQFSLKFNIDLIMENPTIKNLANYITNNS